MLAEHRHNLILSLLAGRGSVSITALREELQVSRETIRRDIVLLAGQNRLRKIHGGAISLDLVEPDVSERLRVNVEGKRAIGEVAAGLVADGASVIIDCGTTAQCVADALARRRNLTVYTNDITICGKLARRGGNQVYLFGGKLQEHENATLGWDTTQMLSHYMADVAFVAPGGISPTPDLLDFTRAGSEFRSLVLASAHTPVVLADHTKFGRFVPIRVANFEKASHLITDRPPDSAMREALTTLPLELLIAGEEVP